MSVAIEPGDNRLLAQLLPETQQSLFPDLEPVDLPLGAVIGDIGQRDPFAYFPIDCLVSQLNLVQATDYAEVCLLGNDSMVGAGVFMGEGFSPSRFEVQTAGKCLRITAKAMRDHFNASNDVRQVMLGFVHYWMGQITRTAGCQLWHTVDQRTCRWLLAATDALPPQKSISRSPAKRFGVVPEVLKKLQRMGAIQCQGGEIRVLDRLAIEKLCCSCYTGPRVVGA